MSNLIYENRTEEIMPLMNVENDEMEAMEIKDTEIAEIEDEAILVPTYKVADEPESIVGSASAGIGTSVSDTNCVEINHFAEKMDAKKKKSRLGRIAVVACLAAAVAGSTFGLGIGVGGGLISHYASSAQPDEGYYGNEVGISSYNPVLLSAVASNKGGVVSIVKKASSSVVSINVSAPAVLFGNRTFEQQSAGSGVIFAENDDNIYILTNYHVVSGASSVTISVDDDKQIQAHAVGGDADADIAVIYASKSAARDAGISYTVASLGNSDTLEVGELVVAIGNAMGEGKTATVGIISAAAKPKIIDNRSLSLLQTDAAINPGNSGGALVNESGQVVGINTAKLSDTGVEGMGYSIPINDARKIVDSIMAGTYDEQPYFGVYSQTITQEIMTNNRLPAVGAYIVEVEASSSAARAGIRSTDIIVGINDTTIESSEDLAAAISKLNVGETVKVYLYRNHRTPLIVDLTVGTRYSSMDF